MSQLTARDRRLLLFGFWPAVLLACVLWLVDPLAHSLAIARGNLEARRVELREVQEELARAPAAAAELGKIAAAADHFRLWTLDERTAVDAVVAFQRLSQEAGLRLRTVRVEETEPMRPRTAGPVAASIPIDVLATGSYQDLVDFLGLWLARPVPLKLSRLEAARDDESGALEIRFTARALLRGSPGEQGR